MVDVAVTLLNMAFTVRQQKIPTGPPEFKNLRSGNISAGGRTKWRQICTRPRLRFLVLQLNTN